MKSKRLAKLGSEKTAFPDGTRVRGGRGKAGLDYDALLRPGALPLYWTGTVIAVLPSNSVMRSVRLENGVITVQDMRDLTVIETPEKENDSE